MRFTGTIKTWQDDRGFGFIEADQGGQQLFFHIKEVKSLRGRPEPGLRVSFEVQMHQTGKKRAIRVEPNPSPTATRSSRHPQGTAAWGVATIFVIPLFLVILLLGHVFGRPPSWVVWTYPIGSVFTFLAYALDKAAAQRGRQRISEFSLHMMAMVGGWPGALIAQQTLRHKSVKREFRATFWGTVVLNTLLFVFLASPLADAVLNG